MWVCNGDLMFQKMLTKNVMGNGPDAYKTMRLIYTPDGTSLGDIMTQKMYLATLEGMEEIVTFWLRVKQGLELENYNYYYSNIYVTNAKGLDEDFIFGEQILNFNKMNGNVMDKMMKNTLFNISFSSDSISYNCYYNGKLVETKARIEVEGNKITVKMSERNPVYRDIEMYAFQNGDNRQFHIYMSTTSFTNFFANISVVHLADCGELNVENEEEVATVFKGVDRAIESINVSIVMTRTAE